MSPPYNQNVDEGGTSQFNAGILQMKRLHELQEQINVAKINPVVFNDMLGIYNYELWISSLVSLYFEIEPKLEKGEKEKGIKWITSIQNYIEENAPHYYVTSRDTKKLTFDPFNWKVLRKGIQTFESIVKIYLDKHGYGSPEADDEDEL